MDVKSITKVWVAFSTLFLCAALAGAAALAGGVLSPRALGTFLALLCLVGFVFLTIAFRRLAQKHVVEGPLPTTNAPSTASRTRQLALVKTYQAAIVVLALCLVGGIVKGVSVHPFPLFPILVGMTMNLLATLGLVIAVRKHQKNLN